MTNKLLLTAIGLLLMATVAQAQTFHYGLKADLSFSNITGKGLKGNFKPGYNAGAFAEYSFNKKWGIQPEVLFTQFNNKSGDDFLVYYVNSGNNNGSSSIKLSYLSIPLLLRYSINDIITLNAGPQYNILLYDNEDLLQSDKAAFRKSDWGVAAGLTIHVSQVRFYGRYVLGLSNINDIDDRYKWKTQQIQLGLGIVIK